MWKQVDKMWEDADKAFAEANKAFEAADRIFKEQADSNSKAGIQQLHFEAHTRKERWNMFRRFFMMSWKILFTGEVDLSYKPRKK